MSPSVLDGFRVSNDSIEEGRKSPLEGDDEGCRILMDIVRGEREGRRENRR